MATHLFSEVLPAQKLALRSVFEIETGGIGPAPRDFELFKSAPRLRQATTLGFQSLTFNAARHSSGNRPPCRAALDLADRSEGQATTLQFPR